MNDFQEQLEKSRALTRALHSFDINLAIEATDKEYAIAGNLFYVIQAPNHTSYIDVRFNEISNPKHRLVLMLGLRTYHERVFITTPSGQAGNITILHGKVDPELFSIIDNRSASMALLSGVLLQLTGDITPQSKGLEKTVGVASVPVLGSNINRCAFRLQAKTGNTGLIYIGFDDSVTTTTGWFAELAATDVLEMDDYQGPIHAIASAADQLLGWGSW